MHLRAWPVLVVLLLPMVAVAQPQPAAATRPMQFTDASVTARGMSTVAVLRTIRSVLELYALQHGDKTPALSDLTDWAILLQQTDEAGRLNPPVGADPKLGPYLENAPTNTLTGHSRLCEIGHVTADAGWIWDARGKRPLILIALPRQSEPVADYLVACNVAIQCPEIHAEQPSTNVGRAAGVGIYAGMHPGLMASLNATLRLQIAQAHLGLAVPQRRSLFPTLNQMHDWNVLLASPGEGAVTPGEPVRPSLPRPLGNPLRNDATKVVATGTARDHPDAGWTYSPATGQLRIVVPADFTPNRILGPDDIERLQPQASAAPTE